MNSAADMQGRAVGVLMGSAASAYLEPYAGKMNVKSYTDQSLMVTDLGSGALDCAVVSKKTSADMIKAGPKSGVRLRALAEPFVDRAYRMAVSQDNKKLCGNINSALASLSESGELKAITSSVSGKEWEEPAGIRSLVAAVDLSMAPFAYKSAGGRPAGIELDVLHAVAEKLGVGCTLVEASSDRMMYLLESGKVSLAVGRLTGSESGKAAYTDPYLTSVQVIVVRDSR